MENKLTCYPVMLPIGQPQFHEQVQIGHNYHLHLISDRDIKEGDWVFYNHGNNMFPEEIYKMTDNNWKDYQEFRSMCTVKKVEATTDPTLGLPLIPKEWIEKEWVGKQGKVEEVWIKMQRLSPHSPSLHWPNPKTGNTKDREVIISPVRASYSAEDMKKAFEAGFESEAWRVNNAFYDWFDKNY